MSDVVSSFGGGTAQPDPLLRFMQRVVAWSVADPPDSFVNVHAFGGTGRRPYRGGGQSFGGPAGMWEAVDFVRYLNRIEAEVFFCLSAQSDYNRERSAEKRVAFRRGIKACLLKAFGLDLDVKPGAYPSQRAALAVVLPFLDGLGLKPGPIVSSGAGLHVYVTLSESISPSVWRPLAAKLAAAAKAAGLHFDQSCTVNQAGLWRMPSSTHRKDPNNPREVKVLGWGEDMTFAAVEAALAGITTGGYTAAAPRAGIDLSFLPPRPPINGPDAERVRADQERARETTSFDLLRSVCGVVADSEERGGDGDIEPLWFELGKLMRFVQDGRAWFHRLSEDDARYDEEQTDAKFDSVTSQGWPRCATIEASSPAASAICQRCPYFKLNLTPIHHARGGTGPVNGQVNGHAHPFAEASDIRPVWLPEGYGYDSNGMIYTPENVRVFNTPVLDIKQIDRSDGSKTYTRLLQYVTPLPNTENDPNTFIISTAVLPSKQKFAEAVSEFGLDCCEAVKNYDPVKRFNMDLLTLIRDKKLSSTQTRQGWVMKDKVIAGFAFGGYLFTPEGKRPISAPEDDIFMPCGTLEEWRPAANAFVGKGCVEMEAIIAASFAAPLMHFTGADGVTIFARSGSSGKGKTASLEAGASVWMSIKEGGILKRGTMKFTMDRVAMMNNLPVCFDDLIPDNDLAREFSRLLKDITSGIEYGRMTRMAVARKQRSMCTLLIANSNRSMVEVSRAADTNAQAARVIEFEMPPPKVQYSQAQVAAMRAALEQNHGSAGLVVAEWLGKNPDRAEKLVREVLDDFEQMMGKVEGERYWVSGTATMYAGACIAKHLGLFDFNLAALKKFLLDIYRRQRATVADMKADPNDPNVQLGRVREFLNEHVDRRLVTLHLPKQGSAATVPLNDYNVRGVIAYRLATEDKKIWLSEARAEAWCNLPTKKYSYSEMRRVLIAHKYWERRRYHRRLGSGCGPKYHTEPEVILEIDLNNPLLTDFSPPEDGTTGETDGV